jgi:hypothetical protein
MFNIFTAGMLLVTCLRAIVALPIVAYYERDGAAVLQRSSDRPVPITYSPRSLSRFVARRIPGDEVSGSFFKRGKEKSNKPEIIHHVDHGKTTLTDRFILATSHSASDSHSINSPVLDHSDLERERGITILAKTNPAHPSSKQQS